MSINSHPLTQLALTIDNHTNCGKDVSQIIVSYDAVDYKQFKINLFNLMQNRIDRELEYKKINYINQERNMYHYDANDYEISTIIHGEVYTIIFASLLRNKYLRNKYITVQILYNWNFSADQISDDNYPRKSLHKLTKEELDKFNA